MKSKQTTVIKYICSFLIVSAWGLSGCLPNSTSISSYVVDRNAGKVYHCSVNTGSGVMSNCIVNNGGASWKNPQQIALTTLGTKTYAYVTDPRTGIYRCAVADPTPTPAATPVAGTPPDPVGTGGALSGCIKIATNSGPGPAPLPILQPMGITLATLGAKHYAYIINMGISTSNNIYKCTLNTTTGDLSSCVALLLNVTGLLPMGISITTLGTNTYAYIADHNGNIFQCSVNPTTGVLSSCQASNGGTSGWAPLAIDMLTLNGRTFAYVADNYGHLYQCSVDATTGTLSSCAVVTTSPSTGPMGFGHLIKTGASFLYIASLGQGHSYVYRCYLNSSTGAPTSCAAQSTEILWQAPTDIAF